jgi:hypothetical protein
LIANDAEGKNPFLFSTKFAFTPNSKVAALKWNGIGSPSGWEKRETLVWNNCPDHSAVYCEMPN